VIVDTSALVAIAREEAGSAKLRDALLLEHALIPAPVLVEYARVTGGDRNAPRPEAASLLRIIIDEGVEVIPFTLADGEIAAAANQLWGTGNGRGGTLNLLDLMVYATAERMRLPILCTGRDFAATGIAIHPASRLE
jgi:ribonuclease VapC